MITGNEQIYWFLSATVIFIPLQVTKQYYITSLNLTTSIHSLIKVWFLGVAERAPELDHSGRLFPLHHQPHHLHLRLHRDPRWWTFNQPIQMKRLTKICWQLIAFQSTPEFWVKYLGLNLNSDLVTSCWGCQTACLRPAYCCLGWGSMSIGDLNKRL